VNVEPATENDVSELLELRDAISAWLSTRGVQQWLPNTLSASQLQEQITDGTVFVVRDGPPIAASLTLTSSDPAFWGDDPTPAGYVHRLMVRRDLAGRGLGSDLLRWAEDTCRQKNRRVLRLDCDETNEVLRRLYAREGFREVGRRFIPGLLAHGGGIVLFEKSLTIQWENS